MRNEPLSLDLLPAKGDGFPPKTANSPYQGYQPLITSHKRSQALRVRASVVNVVHGTLSTGDQATLIITEFRFESGDAARRFRSATINYVFLPMEKGSDGPVIFGMAPLGENYMVPLRDTSTAKDVPSTKPTSAMSSRYGMPIRRDSTSSIATKGDAHLSWKLEAPSDAPSLQEEATVSGVTRWLGRVGDGNNKGYGHGDNSARWVLRESFSTKGGIPTVFQTAVLLKRTSDTNFIATLEIQAEVDLMSATATAFRNVVGRSPTDDPIVFRTDEVSSSSDPGMGNVNRLDKIDLSEYTHIESMSRRDGSLAGSSEPAQPEIFTRRDFES